MLVLDIDVDLGGELVVGGDIVHTQVTIISSRQQHWRWRRPVFIYEPIISTWTLCDVWLVGWGAGTMSVNNKANNMANTTNGAQKGGNKHQYILPDWARPIFYHRILSSNIINHHIIKQSQLAISISPVSFISFLTVTLFTSIISTLFHQSQQ